MKAAAANRRAKRKAQKKAVKAQRRKDYGRIALESLELEEIELGDRHFHRRTPGGLASLLPNIKLAKDSK